MFRNSSDYICLKLRKCVINKKIIMLKSLDLLLINVSRRFVHTTAPHCKGHSKWQNIKNIKAENDRQKQQTISKQMRFIRIAANDGGSPNPDTNPALRFAIEEAKRRDVPRATIQGCLKKLAESKDKNAYQRYLFEGRLYKKLYFVATIFTDNLAFARIQMATAFRKHLVDSTNAKRLFVERGVLNVIARDGINVDKFEDECLTDAIECGAEDIEVYDAAERKVTFFCEPRDFLRVRHQLTTVGHKVEHSECMFIPNTTLVQLNEAESKDYEKFKGRLTDVEGFDEIYDNLDEDDDS